MALTYTQPPTEKELGSVAPDFKLPGVDGRNWSLADFSAQKALVVIFMCNHCPYVIAVQERINELAKEYGPRGVGLVGISPNDPVKYPADSLEAMRERAREQGYVFPYLIDETQEVARAFGAVCTLIPSCLKMSGASSCCVTTVGSMTLGKTPRKSPNGSWPGRSMPFWRDTDQHPSSTRRWAAVSNGGDIRVLGNHAGKSA